MGMLSFQSPFLQADRIIRRMPTELVVLVFPVNDDRTLSDKELI
jgi:hypothetical protein